MAAKEIATKKKTRPTQLPLWKDVPHCGAKALVCPFQFKLPDTGDFLWCRQNIEKKGARCQFKRWDITTSVDISNEADS